MCRVKTPKMPKQKRAYQPGRAPQINPETRARFEGGVSGPSWVISALRGTQRSRTDVARSQTATLGGNTNPGVTILGG